MKRKREIAVFASVSVIFLVGMTLHAWWDFAHPREWDCAGNDPHVYVGAVLVCWLIYGWIFACIFISERRIARAARLAMLLKRAETLLGEKKLQEAEECLDECKALAGYSEAMVPRQFNARRER